MSFELNRVAGVKHYFDILIVFFIAYHSFDIDWGHR